MQCRYPCHIHFRQACWDTTLLELVVALNPMAGHCDPGGSADVHLGKALPDMTVAGRFAAMGRLASMDQGPVVVDALDSSA